MLEQPPILLKLLNCCEIIAAVVGLIYYNRIKKTYWKWFVLYLFYIAVYEIITRIAAYDFAVKIDFYFAKIQVPIEFLFFFWLYAVQSFKSKKIFWICSSLYLLSLIPDESLSQGNYFFSSFNYIIGTLILLLFVVLEFNKQIKSDNILLFTKNKMFYVNIGIVLFYIGTLPFFGLYYPIMKEPEIWNNYYIYFMISNCIMYLLFAASFIWGKVKL